ncbi:C-C motif chemokine 20-like [Betta splendens]|uniref:C-C motif chemokine 20-like n=1 Tax=Betta splendens TaxID=158456 RepID=A0A6P7NJZ5_BETSP|nr:C-C motif chemokine 20-like [Betta splendens]
MASGVAALLLLGVVCSGLVAGEVAMDCCLDKSYKMLPLRILSDYKIQEADQGCDISATLFITKTGRILCVAHPSEREWVEKHIKLLNRRKE